MMEGATPRTPATQTELRARAEPAGHYPSLPVSRELLLAVVPPFVVSRLLLIGLTLATALARHQPLLAVWNQWDSTWYLGIASHGYHWRLHWHHHTESLAFFPLYPLLMRAGMSLGFSGILVGLVISNVAFAGALFYVHRLVATELGEVSGQRAVWLVALFPTAFFTFAPYTEGLFLLCAAGALYHARQGQALTAGFWVAADVVTRPTGIILVLPILLLLGPRRLQSWLQGLGPAVCATAGYLLYLVSQRLPLAMLLQTQHGWHRAVTYPWTGFTASIFWLFHHDAAASNPGMVAENIAEVGVTLLFLLLTVLAWRHVARFVALYCAGFWVLVLTTPEWTGGYFAPFSSMDRFILTLFPLAGWAATRIPAHRFRLILGTSTALMLSAAAFHLSGGWVG